MNDQLLIIFVKNPILGQVKTRLANTIGEEAALLIYKQLLDHTYKITADLNCDKAVYYSHQIDVGDLWEPGYIKKLQEGADLGIRMMAAFAWALKKYQKVCIIGSDCYELDSQIIREAFVALEEYDVVTGPTEDGGYYLLGMTHMIPQLFQNKSWSTDQVMKQTAMDIQSLQLSALSLPKLRDVDEEQDLPEALKILLP